MINVVKEALAELGVAEDKIEQGAKDLLHKLENFLKGDTAALAHNVGDVADHAAADVSALAHNASDVAQNADADVKAKTDALGGADAVGVKPDAQA